MTMDRRDFLSTAAVAGGALSLGGTEASARGATERGVAKGPPDGGRAQNPLSILILGGTNLTGPHNVRYALSRGHSVSIFTRGRREPGMFQEAFEHVEHLIGDRENDLEALKGRTWDAVIDASGMNVAWTRASAQLLKESVGTYCYVSSTGVFYPYLTTDIDESVEPLLEDPSGGENGASRYGVMKAQSENEAREAFGDRALIVRPGYIVGPLDTTQRGTYWPERIRRGGEVMVPGRKSDQVQQIDVRDLTEWMIRCLEDGTHGTFNVTGPGDKTTMEEFVYGVKAAFSTEVSWTWIEDYDFLKENQVSFAIPWIMADGDNFGSQRINIEKAKAAGLTHRPIAVTAVDTMNWYDSLPPDGRGRMTIPREKEAEVLEAWKAHTESGGS